MIAGVPRQPAKPPAVAIRLAAGRPVRAVWENALGGRTFEIDGESDRRFIKWYPPIHADVLDAEAARMRWAVAHTPVPEVIDAGADDDGAWLVTQALPGENAVSPRWTADPAAAVQAIGAGMRAFHDSLPVASCPFSWLAEDRIAESRRRAAAGLIDPSQWHETHQHLSVDDALARVAEPPPPIRLVVCHGDACAPNTLITPDGRWSGHVDLSALGVADPWADLAIATWSTQWNYGPGWETPLLDAYGVDPDFDRARYYRLLWELGP